MGTYDTNRGKQAAWSFQVAAAFASIWFCLHSTSAYARNECLAFSVERLEKVFARPQNNALQAAELKYLDDKLVKFINLKLSSLPNGNRQRIIEFIERVEWRDVTDVGSGDGLTFGVINFSANTKPSLWLSHYVSDHPRGRHAAIHEIGHFIRLDGGSENDLINYFYMQMQVQKRFGLYREELVAFGFNYDFISSAYTADDLPRLKRIFPTFIEEDKAFLESRGIIRLDSTGSYGIDESKLEGLDDSSEIVSRLIRFSVPVNDVFLDDVEKIVTMSRSDYIKEMVRPYKEDQAERNVHRNLRARLPARLVKLIEKFGLDKKLVKRALKKK